jgi:hypothetical protein
LISLRESFLTLVSPVMLPESQNAFKTAVREARTAGPIQKKCGPFSVISSRYLDRGRVWIVGTEDGKRTSQVSDLCGGTQEKLLKKKENL